MEWDNSSVTNIPKEETAKYSQLPDGCTLLLHLYPQKENQT